MRLAALAIALLACAAASCRRPPVVALEFEGIVLDATSGDPVAGAEVSMEVRECTSSGTICLGWRTRTTAGPARTGPDGTFAFSVTAPEDIESVVVAARGYATGGADPLDDEGSTINDLVVELDRTAPVTLDGLTLEHDTTRGVLILAFGEVELGHDDDVLIARGVPGGAWAEPETRTLYDVGDALGDATIVYAGRLLDVVTAMDRRHRYVDADADPGVAHAYRVYPLTAIGIYGAPVSASWEP